MNNYTIRVTKDHLEASRFCGLKIGGELNEYCAIQLALHEFFPEAIVSSNCVYLDDSAFDMNNRIVLPQIAVDFINAFDAASPEERAAMNGFEFELEIGDGVEAEYAENLEFA